MTKGASELSPGDRFNDTRGMANPGLTKEAFERSPGDMKNDQMGATRAPNGASTFAPGQRK